MSERRIEAAGGVVVAGDGRVLLVHRPRYDDWTLPKGKLDRGETFEEAALREVREETGLRCTLGREVATTEYRDSKDRPKVVRYWLMEVKGQRGAPPPFATPQGGRFEPNDEVDEVRWLPVTDAAALLTYGRDREVLAQLAPS
ncbi:MAG: NUDIX hydrolase [Actinomycetota bacterium]|nr:NUDIX hydrolase [Actinomycetota bacterium]